MRESIDREILNAYVDGELDPSAAARLMDDVARNPALAREISALMRAKSALAASVETPPIALPEAPARHPAFVRAAVAAVLVLALTTVIALRFAAPAMNGNVATGWLIAAHEAWSGGPPPERPLPAGPRTIAGHATGQAYVPDLSSARLQIAHIDLRRGGKNGGALIVGYRGTRGCTVTLAVSQRISGLDETLRRIEAGSVRGYAWRAGKFGYYVVAEGMADDRLAGIARGIHEASLRRLPLTTETRMALARSRAASPPCRA